MENAGRGRNSIWISVTFWVFLALALIGASLRADTIELRDGQRIENVRDVRTLEGVVLYVQNNRTLSVAEVKVARVLDRRGRVIYEAQTLTVEEVRRLGYPSEYLFFRNGAEVGRGSWESEGAFNLNGRRMPDGVYLQYHDSGRVKREFTVADGQLNGECRVFFKSGRLEREGNFRDGRETGTSKLFYANGLVRGSSPYQNGRKHGVTKLYYESGQLQAEMPFTHGEPDGKAKLYYEMGALETEVVFVAGQRHGPILQYWETGKPRMRGTFVRGRLDGDVFLFYESGRLRKRQTLHHGRILQEVAPNRSPAEAVNQPG